MNTKKFKDYVKKNKFLIIESAVLATVAVTTYTFVCGKLGYAMTKPYHHDEEYFYVKTISGKFLRSEKFPI